MGGRVGVESDGTCGTSHVGRGEGGPDQIRVAARGGAAPRRDRGYRRAWKRGSGAKRVAFPSVHRELQRDCTESAGPKGGLSDDIDKRTSCCGVGRPTARDPARGSGAFFFTFDSRR